MKTVRWIAVPLASIAVWYASLFAGIEAGSLLNYLCPAELMVSGLCGASWFQPAFNSLVALFAGIAGFLIVISAACMAPSYKLIVAWVAYLVGFVFAVFAVSLTAQFAAFFFATLLGLLAVFSVAKYLGVSMLPNNSLKSDAAKPRTLG